MNVIPAKIKDKVIDLDWSKEFTFESMPCQHEPNAAKHIIKNCEVCQFKEREIWLETVLTNIEPLEKFTNTDLAGVKTLKTLHKIIVVRGKFDDCVGIQREYL